jgi:hypothetical protein
MIRIAESLSSPWGVGVLIIGLSAALPQFGLAQAQTESITHAADHGRWVWSRDHWVWNDRTVEDTHGSDIREAGVADVQSAPLREAGLTLRRMIAVAMSAP